MDYSITKEEVIQTYSAIVSNAQKNCSRKQYQRALKDIMSAAIWAYNYNFRFSDSVLEELLKNISEETVRKVRINKQDSKKVVFFGTLAHDYRGLTQQYLRALNSLGYKILYIHISEDTSLIPVILSELTSYNAEMLLFDDKIKLNDIQKANRIVERIAIFNPAHVFLHIKPWDCTSLIACNALSGVPIYNINLTDHAFWLGASFIDYNIEFRPFGSILSREKRGIEYSKQLFLPFYPIKQESSTPIILPELPLNAIKLFTGGSMYKMFGQDDMFFKIIDKLLSINPNVYLFIAGFDQNNLITEKINNYITSKERVYIIGNRKDLDYVFDNIDIYLNTYPVGGGLMCQYAVQHGKPILAYCDKNNGTTDIAELINNYSNPFVSRSTIEDFMVYARKLVNDKDFRKEEGEKCRYAMMDSKRFAIELQNLLSIHTNTFKWESYTIHYDKIQQKYLGIANATPKECRRIIVQIYKAKALLIFPQSIKYLLPLFIREIWYKIRSKL